MTSELWLPPVKGQPVPERIRGNSAGTYIADATFSFLLHTTEGGSIDGAVSAYRAKNAWPHMTADFDRNELAEHVPLNEPARALRNEAGGVETNRSKVIQLEIVGQAAFMHMKPAWWLDRLGQLLARTKLVVDFDLEAPLRFLGPGDGVLATVHAAQRMTFDQWNRFGAICGHQHAPENTHWDPGRLNVAAAIAAAHAVNPTEEGLRMDAEVKNEFRAIRAELDTIRDQMAKKPVALRSKKDGRVWIVDGDSRWHVPDRETLDVLIWVGQVQGFGSKGPAEVTEDVLDGIPIVDAPKL